MKKYTILPFLLALILLTSCEQTDLRTGMEPIPNCESFDPTESIDFIEGQLGTIREVSFWVPGTPGDFNESGTNLRNDDAIEYKVWIIIPDAYPHMMFEACNLPVAQLIQNRRVSFSGYTLPENPNVTNFEGITPFNLTEITGGIDAMEDHGPC